MSDDEEKNTSFSFGINYLFVRTNLFLSGEDFYMKDRQPPTFSISHTSN